MTMEMNKYTPTRLFSDANNEKQEAQRSKDLTLSICHKKHIVRLTWQFSSKKVLKSWLWILLNNISEKFLKII